MACIRQISVRITYVFTAIVLAFVIGCESEADERALYLDKYYYNIHRFAGPGEVYVYKAASELALPEEIWHYRFDPGHRGNYLNAIMYTPAGDPVQKSIERLNRDNAELLSLELFYFEDDSLHAIEAQINKPVTFSFAAIEEAPEVNYGLEYYDSSSDTDSVRVILNKKRRVTGREMFYFEGEEVPAVRIETREVLETETEGFTTTEWTGTEIFAQDIGLVYYRKKINEQFTLEYTLHRRLTYDEFQTRYKGYEFD